MMLLVQSGVSVAASRQANEPAQTIQQPDISESQSGDGTWYVIDLENTPLVKGIDNAHNNKKGEKPEKVPGESKSKQLKSGGKTVGHVSQNTVTMEYANPNQKEPDPKQEDLASKEPKATWDPVKIKMKPEKGKLEGWQEDAALQPVGFDDTRSMGYGIFSTYNDDADCIDQVTGEHKGGIGKETECFVGPPEEHVMAENLIEIPIETSDDVYETFCQHQEDENFIIPLDECVDRQHTTLVELVDEDDEEILDVDGDGDENDDSDGDGINDDHDCTDNQGGHYTGTDCDQPGRFPLIDEDLSAQIDNDGDGQTSEDPPGKKDDDTLDDPGELCMAYYTDLGLEWSDSFYDQDTGECDVDAAIEKHVNKESNKKFGKNVFHETCEDCDDKKKNVTDKKNKWNEPITFLELTNILNFTYNDNLTEDLDQPFKPPLIKLEVTKDGISNTCNLNLQTLPQESTSSDCQTPPDRPDANFSIFCEGKACTFTGITEDADAYEWDLGRLKAGKDRGGKSVTRETAHVRGQEARTVTVTETMLVQCQPGWKYEEEDYDDVIENPDGTQKIEKKKKVRCKKAVPLNSSLQGDTQGTLALVSASTIPLGIAGYTASPEDTLHAYALMGFTFAPPVLSWGWKIEEEVCVFGFCFEIFYARIGYEFDMGVGLRLPAQVNITPIDPVNWPDNVWAEDSHSFETSITPIDFNVEQFKQVCQENDLADGFFISDCDRFSFPNFLNSDDGDEFVAYYKLFAGIIVRVLSIPIITWGVDSSFDLGQFCTMYNAVNAVGLDTSGEYDKAEMLMNLATLLGDYVSGDDLNFYNFLKDQGILCGSFTTPYGYEEGELREFPFVPKMGYSIPADCTKAMLEGQVVTIKGKPRPICTNLILGTAGANLGLGLNFEVDFGSDTIGADWSAAGDAIPDPIIGDQTNVRWKWGDPDEPDKPDSWGGDPEDCSSCHEFEPGELPGPSHSRPETIGPVIYDNYDLGRSIEHDDGSLVFDDFTYYLNMWLTVSASLEFGGILSPIPDIAEFELFKVSFGDLTGTDGIPFPQHPGMDPIKITARVNNYGLDVLLAPDELSLSPDQLAPFTVITTNLGSLDGSFDNYRVELTNILQTSPPFKFVTDKNNDHDCMLNGEHKGGPGKEFECYDLSSGEQLPDVELLIDEDQSIDKFDEDGDGRNGEDPADEAWQAEYQPMPTNVFDLGPYQEDTAVNLAVTPFWHGMTRPGLYPVKVIADSIESKNFSLPGLFPGMPTILYGYDENRHVFGRKDAFDIAFVKIEEFANPRVVVTPDQAQVLPGELTTYTGEFVNGGNFTDGMNVTTFRPDFNQGGCSLTTLGRPDCPYRTVITRLPDEWIINGFTGAYGPIDPNNYESSTYSIEVPGDWAGMENTPYELVITSTSTEKPAVSNTVTVVHTVEATLKSQALYIDAEIDELIAEIEAANAQGIKTCGLYPVSIHPVKLQSQRALDLILAEKPDQALNALSANLHIMQGAFMRGLDGCKGIPDAPWRADWMLRGKAIIDDLLLATGQ